jgi:hypothetical protein
MLQIETVSDEPVTVAVNCCVLPVCTLAVSGAMVTVTGGGGGGVAVTVTTAAAVLVVSACAAATTWQVGGAGTEAGAV